MKTVYIIRHGKTLWNQEHKMQGSLNSDLTDEGVDQAQKLSEKLRTIAFDKIYSSSAQRAIDTAHLVFPHAKINVQDTISEINMGTWEGQTHEWIESNYPHQWDAFFNEPLTYIPENDGESFQDVANRVKEFITLLNESNDETVAIVSHRITIRIIIALLQDGTLENVHIIEDIQPNSCTTLTLENGALTILDFNSTRHYE